MTPEEEEAAYQKYRAITYRMEIQAAENAAYERAAQLAEFRYAPTASGDPCQLANLPGVIRALKHTERAVTG